MSSVIGSQRAIRSDGISGFFVDGGKLYNYNKFNQSGTLIVLKDIQVEYLIVAGGGAGGRRDAGGGGAGGLLTGSINLSAGSYSVIVGAGGEAEPTGSGTQGGYDANDGEDSIFAGITAIGGGGGGAGGGGSNGASGPVSDSSLLAGGGLVLLFHE